MNWLSETTADALRALQGAGQPAYLLDYDVLHAYSFSAASEPVTASAVTYLLHHGDVRCWVGPGTALEIIRTVNRVVQDQGAARLLENIASGKRLDINQLTGEYERLRRRIQRVARKGIASHRGEDMFGIYLLIDLLARHDIDMLDVPIDMDAMVALSTSLDALRPRRSENNFADALNYATVIASRERSLHTEVLWLLTNSQPLFNERLLSSTNSRLAISRDVPTALYSAIAFDYTDNYQDLVKRTLDRTQLASTLRTDIIRNTLVSRHEQTVTDTQLTQAVVADRITRPVRLALTQLADLVSDPIVLRAQEVFDDLDVVKVNIAKQRGSYEGILSSDARMMEFLYDLGQVIERGSTALGDLWKGAIDVSDETFGDVVRRSLFLKGPRTTGDPIVVMERHGVAKPSPTYVLNWQGGRDSDLVLKAMSAAYQNHGVNEVTAIFGFDDNEDPFAWRIELPLRSEDLKEMSSTRGVVWWVRLHREDLFGLFADLVSDDVETNAMTVGLVGSNLTGHHIVDLQSRTGSHFILGEWLLRALADFGIDGREVSN